MEHTTPDPNPRPVANRLFDNDDFHRRANADDALRAYFRWADVEWDEEVQKIGQGEDRTAFLVNSIVYKLGSRASANAYDHQTLEAARRAGKPWAPPSCLFEITTEFGVQHVMAMPYIVSDGTDADPDALARMFKDAGDEIDFTNYSVINGQPIVIDGCTVRRGSWYA
ncbi:hypothetical protein ACIBKY_51580 [Nonomuraea sp. NPDC050394]|uniref:hypothetical protein n=1 Tax=Nonomuraea sp. NPDC050394 TaxID=3364363 RepID=UPI00378EAA25